MQPSTGSAACNGKYAIICLSGGNVLGRVGVRNAKWQVFCYQQFPFCELLAWRFSHAMCHQVVNIMVIVFLCLESGVVCSTVDFPRLGGHTWDSLQCFSCISFFNTNQALRSRSISEGGWVLPLLFPGHWWCFFTNLSFLVEDSTHHVHIIFLTDGAVLTCWMLWSGEAALEGGLMDAKGGFWGFIIQITGNAVLHYHDYCASLSCDKLSEGGPGGVKPHQEFHEAMVYPSWSGVFATGQCGKGFCQM